MGHFKRKSDFRKTENTDKPFFPQEKFNVTDDRQLSLAHVVLTAEGDSSPTNKKELLDDYGFLGCRSSRSNVFTVHARIDSSGYDRP